MEDSNFHSSLKSIAGEAVPYFSQLNSRRSGAGTLQQEEASRHVYAARLEELPSGIEISSALSRQSSEGSPVEVDHSTTSPCSDGFEYPLVPLNKNGPLEAWIRRYSVFVAVPPCCMSNYTSSLTCISAYSMFDPSNIFISGVVVL